MKCHKEQDEVNVNLLQWNFKTFQDRNPHLKTGGTTNNLDTDPFKTPSFRSNTLLPAFVQLFETFMQLLHHPWKKVCMNEGQIINKSCTVIIYNLFCIPFCVYNSVFLNLK
jgi:hypothetical protein